MTDYIPKIDLLLTLIKQEFASQGVESGPIVNGPIYGEVLVDRTFEGLTFPRPVEVSIKILYYSPAGVNFSLSYCKFRETTEDEPVLFQYKPRVSCTASKEDTEEISNRFAEFHRTVFEGVANLVLDMKEREE